VDYQPGFGYFIDLSQITADQIEITYTVEISGGFEYSTSEIINLIDGLPEISLLQSEGHCSDGYINYTIDVENFDATYEYSVEEDITITSYDPAYSWITVQPTDEAVTYVFTAEFQGCTTTKEIEIQPQTCCDIDPEAHKVTCAGGNDGTIELNITGNYGELEVTWYDGLPWQNIVVGNEIDLTNVQAGYYSVEYTDNENCTGYLEGLTVLQGPDCCDQSPNEPESYILDSTIPITWNTDEHDYILTEDLILEDNTMLVIDSRTIRLAENVKILVKPGAQLHLNETTLTMIPGCGMWKGMECSSRQKQQSPYTAYRGGIRIFDSTIEFAQNAFSNFETDAQGNPILLCVNQDGESAIPCYQNWKEGVGGVIEATNTVFRNNGRDARFHQYNRRQNESPYSIVEYGSTFTNCSFLLDSEHDPALVPYERVLLTKVRYVNFYYCHFQNQVEAFTQIAQSPLIGLYSKGATFRVVGNCSMSNLETCTSAMEGFAYGIYSLYQMKAVGSIVDKMKFNCFRGIYAYMPFSLSIYRNWFEDYSYATAPVHFTEQYATQAFGVYVQGTARYDIRENHFNLANHPRVGCVVNDGGSSNNKVYLNEFNNQPLGLGMYNRNRSSNGGSGLLYQCNTFDGTSVMDAFTYSLTYMGSSFAGINLNQQYYDLMDEVFESAGNQFNNLPSLPTWAEHGNNLLTPVYNYYYAPSDALITSEFYGVNLIENQPPNACNDFVGLTTDHGERIALLETEIATQTAIHQLIVDGGDTEGLTEEVLYSDYNEALELYYNLMNESPALSEEVMLATIERQFQLPQVLLTQLLASNPTAAKSVEIQKALDNQSTPLSEYQREQIDIGLTIISVKEHYEANISALQAQRDQSIHSLMDAIDEDPEHPNPIGAKLALLSNPLFLTDVYLKSELLMANGQYANAVALLENADSYCKLTRADVEEIFHLVYLATLEENLPELLSNSQENMLETIRTTSGPWASAWAESIMVRFGLKEIYSPIYTPDDVPPHLRSSKVSKSDVAEAITCYPNPAKAFAVVQTEQGIITAICLTDVAGKTVWKQAYNNQSQQQVVDTASCAAGCYNVQVTLADGRVFSVQLIVEK
ncbi:MAG: T9SS type A sorting domain-containing protein, partial [Flavobacteriales bacterium]